MSRLVVVVLGLTALLASPLPAAADIAPDAVPAARTGCVNTIRGDLDGDRIADTVIGDPAATVGGAVGAGRLVIAYGQISGPVPTRTDVLYQGDGVIPGSPDADRGFGTVIEVGEVDDDECSDILIGLPGARVGGAKNAGAVLVIFGSDRGLGRGRAPIQLDEDAPGFAGIPERGDRFGETISLTSGIPVLAPALAIGAPREDIEVPSFEPVPDAGAVTYLELGPDGDPVPGSVQLLTQDVLGLGAHPGAGDRFGTAIAIGNLGYNLDPSLFVGTPREDIGEVLDAGALDIIVNLRPGHTPTGVRWTQDQLGVADDVAEGGDHFGAAIGYAGGEYTDYGELAVSAPGEDLDARDAGRVYVFQTVVSALPTAEGLWVLDQGHEDSGERIERGDHFGATLGMFPWTVTQSQHWLVIGVPGEDINGVKDAGLVHRVGVEFEIYFADPVHQGAREIPGGLGRGERLGSSLGGLPYSNNDAFGSLLIGLPDDVEHPEGAVLVIPFVAAASDPEDPMYDPRIWVPGEGAFPLGGTAFGSSATSWDTQYR